MKPFRFHLLGLPHTQVTKEYSRCAYTQKVLKLSNMLVSLGHEVLLYASEENETTAHLVTVISKKEQWEYGFNGPHDYLKNDFNPDMPIWKLFHQRVIQHIAENKKEKDFILSFAGIADKQIKDAFPDLLFVEAGVGYSGVFSDFRVFESYAWMHTVYGQLYGSYSANGNFYDCVIPNYFSVSDFPYRAKKKDYLLFVGRLIDRKGLSIAVEIAQKAGKNLVVAGQGIPPKGVDYRGVVNAKERGKLMSEALALICPTLYVGPFEGVNVEAQLCGTPVICTDWGAFAETVEQGKTGFRCRTLKEFVQAVKDVEKLNPRYIRKRAISLYSTETVKKQYQGYFERLYDLWGKGWHEL